MHKALGLVTLFRSVVAAWEQWQRSLGNPCIVLNSLMLDDFEDRRNKLNLLTRFDAHLMSRFTTARALAIFFAEFMTKDLLWPVRRKRSTTTILLGRILGSCWILRLIWLTCIVSSALLKFLRKLLQFLLREQEQLIRIDTFLP